MFLSVKINFIFIIILHFIIGISLSIYCQYFIDTDTNIVDESIISQLSICSVLLFIWYLYSWWMLTNSIFNPYTLFLAAAMLFNSGQSIIKSLDSEFVYLDGIFSNMTIFRTLVFVIISLYFVHLGALLAYRKFKKSEIEQIKAIEFEANSLMSLRQVGKVLFLISCVPAFLVAQQAVGIILSQGYIGLYQRQYEVTGIYAIFNVLNAFFVPSALFYLAGSKDNRRGVWLSWLILFSYSSIQFFLGSRATAIMPLISASWVHDQCVKKIPRTTLLSSSIIFLIIVMPMIATIRSENRQNILSIGFLLEAFSSIDNPLIHTINEAGRSMLATSYALELVPNLKNYDFGMGYVYALLTLIPNIFWDIHPSISHGTYGKWLVWTVAPITASSGGGLGFSFIAEAFLNFGWYFSFIFMLSLGFFYSKFQLWALTGNKPEKIATIACFMSTFLFFSRSESLIICRSLVWYSFFPYILFLFFKYSQNSSNLRSVINKGC